MKKADVIKGGIEVVGALFAAFSGYLLNVAPPQQFKGGLQPSHATGIASLVALIVLFTVASLPDSRRGWRRILWLILGAVAGTWFAFAALRYAEAFRDRTFVFPPEGGHGAELYVAGTDTTTAAKEYLKANPGTSNAELVADFGGITAITRVWTDRSIRRAEAELIRSYLVVVVLLSIALFSLVELIAAKPP